MITGTLKLLTYVEIVLISYFYRSFIRQRYNFELFSPEIQ
jgi:hypothetical protein